MVNKPDEEHFASTSFQPLVFLIKTSVRTKVSENKNAPS